MGFLRRPAQLRAAVAERRAIALYVTILLVLELAVFAFIVAGTHGWIVPLDAPNTTDFVSFYAAGNLANAGTPALAYDHAAHLAAEEAIVGQGIQYQYFNYPPVYQALFALVAHLPYLAAFIVFQTATLLSFLRRASRPRRLQRHRADRAARFPAVWWNFGLGQNAFLTAAFSRRGDVLVDGAVLAGLASARSAKPHFALLVPLALGVSGHWRAFLAAAALRPRRGAAVVALLGCGDVAGVSSPPPAPRTRCMNRAHPVRRLCQPFGAMRLIGAACRVPCAGVCSRSSPRRGGDRLAARPVAAGAQRGARFGDAGRRPLSLLYDMMLAPSPPAGCCAAPDARRCRPGKTALAFYPICYRQPRPAERSPCRSARSAR